MRAVFLWSLFIVHRLILVNARAVSWLRAILALVCSGLYGVQGVLLGCERNRLQLTSNGVTDWVDVAWAC